jgi:uncharacterized protein
MNWRFSRALPVCVLLASGLAGLASSADAEPGRESVPKTRLQEETPMLPAGVRAEKVTFSSNGLTLSGRILLPKLAAGKRAPAMLLLSGSNLQTRGAVTIAPAPRSAFAQLGALMSGKGLVVFSYDTSCNGASECKRDLVPQDFTGDAIAAFRYLAKRGEVDPAKIVVLGHDEGGLFAAGVAGNLSEGEGKVFGLVLVNTPGRVYGKVLRDAAQKRLLAAGKSPEAVRAYLAKFDAVSAMIATGSLDLKAVNADENDPLFSQFAKHKEYIFNTFINDPLQMVRAVASPLLIVQGGKDVHIGIRDAQYLKEAVDRQYLKDATLEILPEMDHWMRAQESNVAFRDDESSGPLDTAFTNLISGWIEKRLK